MNGIAICVILAVSMFAAVACAPAAPTPAKETAPAAGAPASTAPTSQPWERQWQDIVAAARQEGTVVVYGSGSPAVRDELAPKLKERFGIQMEFVSAKGAQLTEKIDRERRAGLFLADIYIGGPTTLTNDFKPKGFLDPLDPALLLPEVTDTKLWVGGKLSYVDADHMVLGFAASTDTSLAFNTDLVKSGEVKGYKDILDPKWKGKLVMGDPTVAGTAAQWYGMVSSYIMSVDYMRQLAKQEPAIVRDLRMQVEWMARGKYPILIVPHDATFIEFRDAGAPITEIIPAEGTFLKSGGGNIAIINRPAHPNAARVFVNWFLSKEGGLLWQKATGQQSSRLDVPTDYLDAMKVRQPGLKYVFGDDEEFLKRQPDQMREAMEVFGSLIK